jgi:sugar phosphate isomerase/epimerase
MRRLQIGMWGQFSLDRWNEIATKRIKGIEISSFPDRDSLREVSRFCQENDLSYGVHGPILNTNGFCLPRLNSPNQEEFKEALWQIEGEACLAAEFGADYILFHYPFLPIFQEPLKQRYPRLPDRNSRYEYAQISKHEFREISKKLFHTICELQEKGSSKILLEHDFFGDYGEVVVDVFHEFPDVGLVVDTARVDIAYRAFYDFEPYEWLTALASQVYLVHFSNVRYEKDHFVHHLPALPEQDDDDNFGEAFQYLKFLADKNKDFHVTFEHNSDLVSKEQLSLMYDRVADLFAGNSGHVYNET